MPSLTLFSLSPPSALHRRILWFSAWRQAAHVLVLLLASQLLMLAVRLVAGGRSRD